MPAEHYHGSLVSSYNVRHDAGKSRPWARFEIIACFAIAINFRAVCGPNGKSAAIIFSNLPCTNWALAWINKLPTSMIAAVLCRHAVVISHTHCLAVRLRSVGSAVAGWVLLRCP